MIFGPIRECLGNRVEKPLGDNYALRHNVIKTFNKGGTSSRDIFGSCRKVLKNTKKMNRRN